MNKSPVSGVNPDMGDLVARDAEEQDVPGSKVTQIDTLGIAKLLLGAARDIKACFFVGVLHQATAVKAIG